MNICRYKTGGPPNDPPIPSSPIGAIEFFQSQQKPHGQATQPISMQYFNEKAGLPNTIKAMCNRSNQNVGLPDTTKTTWLLTNDHTIFPDTTKTTCYGIARHNADKYYLLLNLTCLETLRLNRRERFTFVLQEHTCQTRQETSLN